MMKHLVYVYWVISTPTQLTFSGSVQDDAFENKEFVSQRINQDNTVNKYEHKLVAMCKHLNLCSINDRCGDDKDVGKTTSKNVSTVEYCIQ